MDIKLRDNIGLAQFSKRFPDQTMLHPGSSLGNRYIVMEKPSSHACNERSSSSLKTMIYINDLPHTNMRIHISTHIFIHTTIVDDYARRYLSSLNKIDIKYPSKGILSKFLLIRQRIRIDSADQQSMNSAKSGLRNGSNDPAEQEVRVTWRRPGGCVSPNEIYKSLRKRRDLYIPKESLNLRENLLSE